MRNMITRRNMKLLVSVLLLTMVLTIPMALPAHAGKGKGLTPVRFATFNASLNRFNSGDLDAELAAPGSPQPSTVAEIIQRTRPDVLLINEFDFNPASPGTAADLFQQNYLSVSQGEAAPINYPFGT